MFTILDFDPCSKRLNGHYNQAFRFRSREKDFLKIYQKQINARIGGGGLENPILFKFKMVKILKIRLTRKPLPKSKKELPLGYASTTFLYNNCILIHPGFKHKRYLGKTQESKNT